MCIRLYCSNNLIYRERTVENVKLSRSTAAHCYRDVQLLIRNGVTGRFPTVGAETHTDTHTHRPSHTLTHIQTYSNTQESTHAQARIEGEKRKRHQLKKHSEAIRIEQWTIAIWRCSKIPREIISLLQLPLHLMRCWLCFMLFSSETRSCTSFGSPTAEQEIISLSIDS